MAPKAPKTPKTKGDPIPSIWNFPTAETLYKQIKRNPQEVAQWTWHIEIGIPFKNKVAHKYQPRSFLTLEPIFHSQITWDSLLCIPLRAHILSIRSGRPLTRTNS
jgi:hypothetical protein